MAKTTNVLYLAYDGMTDPLGQSQVLSYLRPLSEKGYHFDVVSFEKPGIYEARKQQVEDMIKGYDITWHPLPYTKSPPVLSTIKDLMAGWKKIKELAGQKQLDIVHTRGYVVAILARLTKKRFGSKMIFDMRGWWPDEKLESGLWSSPLYKPVYNYFKGLEKKFFGESDLSISLTQVGKDEIVRLGLKQADKVGVIPTCVDFDVFKPFSESTREEVRKELDIPISSKVLLYSGSLGGNYDTGMMTGLFKAFKAANNDSVLLIISRTDHEFIKQDLTNHGIDLKDVRIIDSEFKQVHRYLMAGDYGVVNYSRTFSTIGRSPTKLGEYWACGLPVVSLSNVGDLDYLVARYKGGGVLIPEPAEPYFNQGVQGLLALQTDKAKLREYSLDYYDLKKGAEAYAGIYAQLTNH